MTTLLIDMRVVPDFPYQWPIAGNFFRLLFFSSTNPAPYGFALLWHQLRGVIASRSQTGLHAEAKGHQRVQTKNSNPPSLIIQHGKEK
jgi:hypothetical protein